MGTAHLPWTALSYISGQSGQNCQQQSSRDNTLWMEIHVRGGGGVYVYVSDSATLWTVAHQAPLSMGFSRQEYWSGLLCPPPGDLPNPGIGPTSLRSPALAGKFFTTNATWKALPDTLLFTKLQAFFRFPHVFHWCPLFSCPRFHIHQSCLLPFFQSDSFWIFPFLS